MKEKVVDRLSYFINPSFIGLGKSALLDIGVDSLSSRPRLVEIESKQFESDIYLTGKILCSQD